MRRKQLGDNHTAVGRTLHNIGVVRNAAGDHAAAVTSMTEAEVRLRSTLGPAHPELVVVLTSLGTALEGAGQRDVAETKLREGLALGLKTLPEDHPSVLGVRAKLGNLLAATKRFAEAEQMLVAVADAREKRFGRDHATTKTAVADVARLYDAWGKIDQAANWHGRLTNR